jgi:membrane associated rhomboid family serine protease
MSSLSLTAHPPLAATKDDPADPFLAALGPVARTLHRAATTQGPSALAPRVHLLRRPFALSTHAAAALLVAAAHTGCLASARSLARELDGVLPRGAGLYWLALTLQRQGRAASAASALDRALGRRDLDPAVRPWLQGLRARAMEPAPAVGLDALRDAVRDRARARMVLASLSLGPWGPGGASLARSPATVSLVSLMGGVFALEHGLGGPTPAVLARLGALVTPPHGLADLPRLVAYLPLHATPWHLGMNALVLAVFGRFVESRRGWRRMLGVFLGAGVLAGVSAWSVAGPDTLMVGASGAVLGLVGATLVALLGTDRLRATPEMRAGLAALGALLAAQCGSDLAGGLRVSAAAHLGGLVAGAALMAWAEYESGRR